MDEIVSEQGAREPAKARRILQPGPPHARRIESAAGPLVTAEILLDPGLTLCEAVAQPIERLGLRSAAVVLSGARLAPMQYVMPTYSRSADHVAFYSETYRPEGEVSLDLATATFGYRDGAPFMHCHALWRGPQGQACGGHILPLDTRIGTASRATVFGTAGVDMLSRFDDETNFTLFGPEPATGDGAGELIVARIRPNEDLVSSIEAICRNHGVQRARVRSGVGSTIGAMFEDGLVVDEIPTEIVVIDGQIAPDADGQPRCRLEIALIDAQGRIHRGRPIRGQNPVLICCELFIDARTDPQPA